MKPVLRVVVHVHQLVELSKAQKKNSPQVLSCTIGQDNLQKTPSPLSWARFSFSVRGEGSVVSGL